MGFFVEKISHELRSPLSTIKGFTQLSKLRYRNPNDFDVSNSGQGGLEGVSILVVDDAHDNCILMAEILRRLGSIVDTASEGREAIQKISQFDFDLVLMDMEMPVLNGYEATMILRESGYDKPIVALTAHTGEEELQRCISSGCTDYLVKPVEVPLLLETILKHLNTAES